MMASTEVAPAKARSAHSVLPSSKGCQPPSAAYNVLSMWWIPLCQLGRGRGRPLDADAPDGPGAAAPTTHPRGPSRAASAHRIGVAWGHVTSVALQGTQKF